MSATIPEHANLLESIRRAGACDEAFEWVKSNEYDTLVEAWDACSRGDWMAWAIAWLCKPMDLIPLVRIASDIIRLLNIRNDVEEEKVARFLERWAAIDPHFSNDSARSELWIEFGFTGGTGKWRMYPRWIQYGILLVDKRYYQTPRPLDGNQQTRLSDLVHNAGYSDRMYMRQEKHIDLDEIANIIRQHIPIPPAISEPFSFPQ
jgi:hypothetical protein